MPTREALERRVYRLATLLTGDPNAATKVIESVVDAQPDLSVLDNAHMDRLTVLRSREIEPRMIAQEALPASVAEALSNLPPQQREAWVFGRVYQLSTREMARAMDCSHTAAERHLAQAAAAMGDALGTAAASSGQLLLEYALGLEVPPFYRARRDRRRRFRRAVQILILASILIGIIVLAQILW